MLQLIQDRQHTSIIADELTPVTKIQFMIPYTTVHYNALQLRNNLITTLRLQLAVLLNQWNP